MDYDVTQEFIKVWRELKCKASCGSVGGDGWLLTGNAGTDASLNFIGTTDNVDLIFKVNNLMAGIISYTDRTTGFGREVLNSVTTGTLNTAFGSRALFALTEGAQNIAIGGRSGQGITTGDSNTTVGYSSGISITTGGFNTCIGADADVASGSVSSSIALGHDALADVDNQFAIPDTVTTIKFKGLTYTLPTSLPLVSGVLTCDNAGVLTWA